MRRNRKVVILMVKEGLKYLVTTDNWFTAPDGEQYRAVWGTCKVKSIIDVFGFSPSRPSTNWYLEIGEEGKEAIVAGCQIQYAVRCEERPVCLAGTYERADTPGLIFNTNGIYFAE